MINLGSSYNPNIGMMKRIYPYVKNENPFVPNPLLDILVNTKVNETDNIILTKISETDDTLFLSGDLFYSIIATNIQVTQIVSPSENRPIDTYEYDRINHTITIEFLKSYIPPDVNVVQFLISTANSTNTYSVNYNAFYPLT